MSNQQVNPSNQQAKLQAILDNVEVVQLAQKCPLCGQYLKGGELIDYIINKENLPLYIHAKCLRPDLASSS